MDNWGLGYKLWQRKAWFGNFMSETDKNNTARSDPRPICNGILFLTMASQMLWKTYKQEWKAYPSRRTPSSEYSHCLRWLNGLTQYKTHSHTSCSGNQVTGSWQEMGGFRPTETRPPKLICFGPAEWMMTFHDDTICYLLVQSQYEYELEEKKSVRRCLHAELSTWAKLHAAYPRGPNSVLLVCILTS